MYGRGNHAALPGQGLYSNTPPFHQRPPGPPPPPPSISQGLHAPLPSMVPQGRPPMQMYPNSVSSSGTNNQPYLTSLPPHPPSLAVPGTSQMPQHSHWTPNASFVSPAGLLSAPRVLPPPPRPQPSGYYASLPAGSFEHQHLSRNEPSGLPPPPPGPAPPLPSSSIPGSAPSPLSSSPFSSSSPSRRTIPVLGASPNISNEMTTSASAGDGGVGPTANDGNLCLELPHAPPKPADDKIVRNIEVLCQFIAKNGPEFENMTRLRESSNPEFKFLFGGEPGSEAAVAHDYFLWVKRKSHLESLGKVVSSNVPSRQSEDSLHQQVTTSGAGDPSSPADSDMDMEDDITHPLEEPPSFSSVKQSNETVSVSNGCEKEQQVQSFVGIAEPGSVANAVEVNFTYSQRSESGSRERSQNQDGFLMGKSDDVIDSICSRDVGNSVALNRTATSQEDLSQPSTSAELAEVKVEKLLNPPSKQCSSPFRLVPHYCSDESSGDVGRHVDSALATSVQSVAVDTANTDDGFDLGTDRDTGRVLETDKGLEYVSQPSKSHSELRDEDVGRVGVSEKKKDPKIVSSTLKVDEFGRLIREGDSDSDNDGSPRYNRRKRSRSRSKSRSPDRRRRRSPRRRNERRGRSRSFSPRRRSPPSRHAGETSRRDRRPECFDFIKGKCYRGASCRYSHHEEKSKRSRSHRSSRQQLPDSSRSTSGTQEQLQIHYKKSSSAISKVSRNEELKGIDDSAITEEKKDSKEVINGSTAKAPRSLGKGSDFQPSLPLRVHSDERNDSGRPSAIEDMELRQSQSRLSDQFAPNLESASRDIQSIVKVQPPADRLHLNDEAAANPSNTNASSTRINFGSDENCSAPPVVTKESLLPVTNHLSDLPAPFPSVPPVSSSRDSNLTLPAANFLPTVPANFPPYQVSHAHSHFAFPSNQSWNSVPSPPPQSHPPRPAHLAPRLQFTQNMLLPPGNDYYSQTSVRPHVSEFPQLSRFGQSQGGPCIAAPGTYPSSSYGQESLVSQPVPFLEESNFNRQSVPGENLPPAGGISIVSQRESLLAQPSYAVEFPALHGENVKQSSSLPGYTSGFEGNQSSVLSNLGASRIPNHFNPYASTFEQPLSSKLSSTVLALGKDKPFISSRQETAMSQIPADGRAVAGLGSLPPPEGALPEAGSHPYDPLFDSIEPSSSLIRKSHSGQRLEITDESDDTFRFSGSNKPLDGETMKQKVGGPSDRSGSLENDEFGETGDTEVGAVENGSPSNPLDAADEDEIDQVKSPGKSKKTKESRSMRLFKIAIANFVKEVLKPSWRQGNMSKEAFKTIVKKTVDRVSGAMKSHQIPKSQAKINHYIDSSQRKLTKLVMGYVDKYVKV